MAQKVACGLIIYRKSKTLKEFQYLLLQTSYGRHHWTPPKGHVDPGEDELQTAQRETQEEAGYSPDHYTLTPGYDVNLNYNVQGVPKRVRYWLAGLKDPDRKVVLSDEHQDFKWLNLRDAQTISGFSDMNKALQQAEDLLQKCDPL